VAIPNIIIIIIIIIIIFIFCLISPFFTIRVRQVPKRKLWGIVVADFLQLDALLVGQATASKN